MLEGKTAIVTGSSRGIGRSTALLFARNGARVVINHTRPGDAIDETRAELDAAGAEYIVCQGDISDVAFVKDMVAKTASTFGSVDILINNAGITRDRPTMLMTDDDWYDVLTKNLSSAFLCSREVLRPMMRQKDGRIVMVSSVTAASGRVGQVNYGAAKSGMNGMMRSLAREVGRYQIRVNSMLVGITETDMTKQLPKDMVVDLKKGLALQRFAEPEEIANVALFLASDMSSFVTGAEFLITGGGYM